MPGDPSDELRDPFDKIQLGFDNLRGFQSIKGWSEPDERVDYSHPDTLPAVVAIDAALKRAKQLLSFAIHGERGDPFFRADFGSVPNMPVGPLLPGLAAARGLDPYLDQLVDGLEALLAQVVFMADCQEAVDALNTSRQYLYAAGTIASLEPHVLTLAAHLLPPDRRP